MSVTRAGFTIVRRYASTPAQTFSAFADPALRRRWFAKAAELPEVAWELDFRVGGGEVNTGGPAGGPPHVFRSRFPDIVAGERIVFAYDLLFGDRLVSVSLLDALAGGRVR